jgi:hypothetical protein
LLLINFGLTDSLSNFFVISSFWLFFVAANQFNDVIRILFIGFRKRPTILESEPFYRLSMLTGNGLIVVIGYLRIHMAINNRLGHTP